MAIQPVKRTRAYEEIVQQLAEMVRQGELKPGDRLPSERDLATAFGVGRPTLRQALTVLAQAGVVEIVPGSGIYLRKPVTEAPGGASHAMAMVLITESKDLLNMLELRIAIESEAAFLAAMRRTPEAVERLMAAYNALERAFTVRHEAIEEDYQFHCAVAAATDNPVFVKVMASLADLFLQMFRKTTESLYHEPDRILANLQEHRAILEAIVDQRAEDAREAMVRHLRRVFTRLERARSLGASTPADL
ncbi:MAG: FadR/GntR family transcriptional regulator [Bacillota bacterium]